MALDGTDLVLTYPDNNVFTRRCHIVGSSVTVLDRRPEDIVWTAIHVNWPYYWEVAMGFDQPAPMGRMDQDMVFTLEQLWMPIDTQLDQGWWIQDVSVRADGTPTRGYGRWFVCRGNPLWEECPEDLAIAPLIASCSTEAFAPPAVLQALAAAGVPIVGVTLGVS